MTFNDKRPFIFLATLLCAATITAQNGINSPYTRYGFGLLSDQSLGANKAMGGVGYALRSTTFINLANPAAISAVDSLTFMMDAGFTLQNGNFEENGTKVNAKNASFDYIALQYRLSKHLGMAIGLLPFSNVGYSFSSYKNYLYPDNESNFTAYNTFTGDGGLHQLFAGLGTNLTKDLSVGGMFSYLYGDISHKVSNTFSDANIRSRVRYYNTSVTNYKLDLGVQYGINLGKDNRLTLGLTYSLGHKLQADAKYIDQVLSSSTVQSGDTTTVNNVFSLPHTFGIGAAYQLGSKWTFALDYTLQKWGECTFFSGEKGYDRNKVSLGVEYYPNGITSRNLLKHIRYRAGAYYSDPYTRVNGQKGSYEYGFSAGFSIPIVNNYNNRSSVNISGQYVRVEPKVDGLIGETYLRLNIGISFNESWFMKLKVN